MDSEVLGVLGIRREESSKPQMTGKKENSALNGTGRDDLVCEGVCEL